MNEKKRNLKQSGREKDNTVNNKSIYKKFETVIGKILHYFTICYITATFLFVGFFCLLFYDTLPKLTLNLIMILLFIHLILYGIAFFISNIQYKPSKNKSSD